MLPKFVLRKPLVTSQKDRHSTQSILFITCNILSAFYNVIPFFLNSIIVKIFTELDFVIPWNYQPYIRLLISFSFIAIFLNIFGSHVSDVESKRGLLAYLIITAVLFIFELVFIAYLMKFKENFIEIVEDNFKKIPRYDWRLMDVQKKFNCSECVEEIKILVDDKLSGMIYVSIGMLFCLVSEIIFLTKFNFF